MAVFYEVVLTDPNNVGWFPESVTTSTWFENLATYITPNVYNKGTNAAIFKFSDLDTLNSWIATYTCTDPTVISEIELWKSAHGVSYTSTIYSADSGTVGTNIVG